MTKEDKRCSRGCASTSSNPCLTAGLPVTVPTPYVVMSQGGMCLKYSCYYKSLSLPLSFRRSLRLRPCFSAAPSTWLSFWPPTQKLVTCHKREKHIPEFIRESPDVHTYKINSPRVALWWLNQDRQIKGETNKIRLTIRRWSAKPCIWCSLVVNCISLLKYMTLLLLLRFFFS